MLPDYDLKALERRCREYPTPESSCGMDYTQPIHWAKRSDGVWIYEGDRHVTTITFDMMRDGLLTDCMDHMTRVIRDRR